MVRGLVVFMMIIGGSVAEAQKKKPTAPLLLPSRKPANTVQKSNSTSSKWGIQTKFTPYGGFSRIDAEDTSTGSQGIFLTKMNAGTDLDFQKTIASKYFFKVGGGINYLSYNPPGSASFEAPQKYLYGFRLGGGFIADEKRQFDLTVAREKDVFIRANSPNSFVLDDTFLYRAKLTTFYTSSKWDDSSVKLRFAAFGSLPANTEYGYSVKMGYGGEFGIHYQKQLGTRNSIEPQVFYRYMIKDADRYKQRQQDLIFALGIIWDL